MPKSDGSIEIDARISTESFKKNLKEMVTSAESSTDDIAEKGDKMFKAMKSATMKLAAEYKKAGMDSSEASKKAWAEVKKTAEYSAVMAAKEAAKASKQVQKSAAEASQGTQGSADKAGDTIKQILNDVAQKADETYSDIGEKGESFADTLQKALNSSNPIIDEFSKKIKGALTVAGIAAGAAKIVQLGTDYDKAMNQVAVSTGAAGKELENLQNIASNVYSNNFGENMEDAATGVTEVYKRTGLIDEELQKATESAFLLKDTFGYEVAESTQAATQLMKVFGVTADEAYTLIAQGAQQGLDQNGDMLDTLNEYSVQFANLGYSAEDMFNMLKNGVDEGTWSVDKLGDAVKEMNIRLNDGTADKALESLGLGFSESAADAEELKRAALNASKAEVSLAQAQKNANDTLAKNGENSLEYSKALNDVTQAELDLADAESEYNAAVNDTNYNLDTIKSKLAAGGESAKEAQQQILTALMAVEDEQERYVLGQTLMGTMWEDLGENAVNALMNTNGEISKTKDTLEEMSAVKYDDLGSQFESLRRQAETEIIVPLTKKYMPKIKEGLDWVSENLDEIIAYGKPIATALATAFAVKKVTEFGSGVVKTINTIKTATKALNMSNPLGWVMTGISAIVGLQTALNKMGKAAQEEYRAMIDEASKLTEAQEEQRGAFEETADEWDRMHESSKNSALSSDIELKRVRELKEELSELVNADGTVKDGTQQKVTDILNEINDLSGSCFELSDNLITQNGDVLDSYDAISKSIDNIIEKNRINSYIKAYEDEFNAAATGKKDNAQAVIDAQNEIHAEENYRQSLIKSLDYRLANNKDGSLDPTLQRDLLNDQLEASYKKQEELEKTLFLAEQNQSKANSMVELYQQLLAAQDSGNYEKAAEIMEMLNFGFIDAASAPVEVLEAQLKEAEQYYSDLKALKTKNPTAVTDEELDAAAENAKRAAEAYAGAGLVSGEEFMKNLLESGKSEEEMIDELNSFISQKLQTGADLNDIAKELGINYTSGFEGGIYDGIPGIEEAVKALSNAAEATLRINLDIHSPSKLAEKIGGYFDKGMEIGVFKGIPGVEAVTAQMADAAVASTMGIMNAQGAASVSAASPVYREVYSSPSVPISPITASSAPPAQTNLSPSFNIYIGSEEIRDFVIDTITDANANSGGWSV